MKAIYIINPNSGPKSIELSLEESISILRKKGYEVEKNISRSTSDAKDFTLKAIKEKSDVVVVVGGDGTINEVTTYLANTNVPMAIIPTGTANVFANQLNIPTRNLLKTDYISKATEIIINGKIKEIDLGKATFEDKSFKYFVMWCGIGIDAAFTQAKKIPPKSFLGRITNYLKWFFKIISISIRFQGSLTQLKLDKRTKKMNLLQAIIGNGALYANYFTLSSSAKLDDGLLDVYLLEDKGLIFRLKILTKSLFSKKLFSLIDTTQNKKISIHSESPLPVHVDAETVGTTPVDVEVAMKALRVFVPKN